MNRSPAPKVVFLTGFMGAGKSSVGRTLAHHLRWRFIDLDRRIEKTEGTNIARIFEQRGERGFRRAESAALRGVLAEVRHSRPAVVALGGGTLTVAANRRRLRDRRALVFLDAPLSVLHRRCRHVGRTRPLFASVQQFKKLYRARLPQYRKAQLRVSTWRNQPQAVAARIAATLGLVPIRRSGENPA